MRSFTLYWGASGGGWTAEYPPERLLAALEQSPFVPLTAATEMDANLLNRWQPYDHAAAVQVLRRGKEPTLRLRIEEAGQAAGQADPVLACWVSPGVIRSMVHWSVREEQVRGHDPEAILAWLRQVATGCWPQFTDAHAEAAFDMRSFSAQHHLPTLPKPLALGWAHLLTPAGVAYTYDSLEAFLRAPAYRVRQLEEGGLIELVVYADPFGYDRPDNQRRIIEVTRYLDAHRHERFRRVSPEERRGRQP
jgi:hypothetical protein